MADHKSAEISRRDFLRRAACAAVGTAAMTSAISDLRLMNAAVAQSNIGANNYKALVCIFLQGGNDSNNLIIPTSAAYGYYNSTRTPVLAIPQSAILPVTSLGSNGTNAGDGNTYGLHPGCPELQQLFGEGKLAFLFNTGTLVYPLTLAQYSANSVPRPPQLFSHADQQTQWQTSVPDQPPTTGWGGRCADLLNSVLPTAPISLMVTLAGANTFEIGNLVSQYSVSTSGAISLSLPFNPGGGANTNRLPALLNLLGLPYTNLQAQAYAGVAEQSIHSAALLNNAIASTAAPTYWTNANPLTGVTGFPAKITPPVTGGTAFTSTLSPQLQMVARLIAAGSTAAASGGFGMRPPAVQEQGRNENAAAHPGEPGEQANAAAGEQGEGKARRRHGIFHRFAIENEWNGADEKQRAQKKIEHASRQREAAAKQSRRNRGQRQRPE